MTTKDKNIAIAEMLGAVKENWYPPNKDNQSTGNYYIFPAKTWYPSNVRHHGDYQLKFDTDAEWQYKAVEFIEALDHSDLHYKWPDLDGKERSNFGGYTVDIERNYCYIQCELQLDPPHLFISSKGATKKEAVFEVLYEFSQYLKNLK
jgi:hypothetical protein